MGSKTDGKKGLSPLLLIFLTIFIDMIGFGIVIPILPLYSESPQFGASPTEIGLLLGSFSAFQLIFAPVLGRLSDRVGRRPVLVISILGTALGFMILGLANTLWLLFLGRIIDGISGGNISTAQAYIADITPVEKRSSAMGVLGAAFGLGFVIGPALGGLLGQYSIQAPFLFAAALAVLNALLLFFFLPESLPEEKRGQHAQTGSFWQTFKALKGTALMGIMACSLVSTIAFSLVTALFTLFTQANFNWHVRENGWMFAYIGFLGVIIQGGLLRRLIPRTGEKPLIIIGTVSLCLAMFLLPVSGTFEQSFLMLMIATTGIAIGNGLVTPVLNGWASKSADEKSQGSVMGLMQSIASLGRMIGPPVGGVLLNYDLHHQQGAYGITPFWASGVLMILAVIISLRLKETHVHIPDSAEAI